MVTFICSVAGVGVGVREDHLGGANRGIAGLAAYQCAAIDLRDGGLGQGWKMPAAIRRWHRL